jgi:hypothetical protein
MYVLAPEQAAVTFPYSVSGLQKDNPQVSFPDTVSVELLASFNVFPVVSTNPDFDRETQVIEQNGCSYNADENRWETAWIIRDKTAQESQAELDSRAAQIRLERNNRLAQCDWTQLPDAPVDSTVWATYRQELRDLTAQATFPAEVAWPAEPT